MLGIGANILHSLNKIEEQLAVINNHIEELCVPEENQFQLAQYTSSFAKQGKRLAKLNAEVTQAYVRSTYDRSISQQDIREISLQLCTLNFLQYQINLKIHNIFNLEITGFSLLTHQVDLPTRPSSPTHQELTDKEKYDLFQESFKLEARILESIIANIQEDDSLNAVDELIHKADSIVREDRKKLGCDDSGIPPDCITCIRDEIYGELRLILKKEPEQNTLEEFSTVDFKFSNLEKVTTASRENRLRAVQRVLVTQTEAFIERAVNMNDIPAIAYGFEVLEKIHLDQRDSFEGKENPAHYLYGQLYAASQQLRNENPELDTIDENSGDFGYDFGKKGWTDERVHQSVKDRAIAEFENFVTANWH